MIYYDKSYATINSKSTFADSFLIALPSIKKKLSMGTISIVIMDVTPQLQILSSCDDKWTLRESNPRPLACKASALPTELKARYVYACLKLVHYHIGKN